MFECTSQSVALTLTPTPSGNWHFDAEIFTSEPQVRRPGPLHQLNVLNLTFRRFLVLQSALQQTSDRRQPAHKEHGKSNNISWLLLYW